MFPSLLGVTQTPVMLRKQRPRSLQECREVTDMDGCMDVAVRLWGLETS